MSIKYKAEKAWLWFTFFLRPTFIANECGHKTKIKGEIKFFSYTSIMKMPLSKNGRPDYCLECVAKMTIKCAWCGNPIVIGSPITLYTPKESFEISEYAVRYMEDDSKALIGCCRGSCIDLPDDMRGHWMLSGEVRRCEFPTPF